MEKLYNYIFHFNYLDDTWNAFTRENYKKYWNGELEEKEILQSRNAMVLVKIMDIISIIYLTYEKYVLCSLQVNRRTQWQKHCLKKSGTRISSISGRMRMPPKKKKTRISFLLMMN